jgi:tetratricopeptide (TPR) repeat protein
MSDETVLNLFVSSPGDVWRERERVDFVVERLNAEFRGRALIRTVRWETQYYSSHDTFQAQIPEASACDLVLAIFGARLGSPLPETFPPMPSGERYPSGTAYEVLSAIEARRRGQGIPDIYVFRRPFAPLVALDAPDRADVEAQWTRLKGFFETWFRNRGGEFLAAFQEFASTDEFAAKVEDCLRQWLERRGFPARNAMWDRAELGSPYPGLASFDESRRAVFFGRSLVIDQAIRRLREVEAPANEAARAPFLLLIGASGSGKSSLLRAGLIPRVNMPGVLPEVDLWRRAITAPGLDPFLTLAESVLAPDALGPELSSGPFRAREILAKQLAGDPDAAIAPLRAALDAAAEARRGQGHFETARPARLFLAIDQAERLLVETPAELQPRFAALIAAMCRHRVATVVIALRSDAYARFQALDAFVALRDAGATLDLLPATRSELEEMVTRPATLCEPPLAFERRDGRSLATMLVDDAIGGDALPLLQMTLARLAAAESGRGDGVLRFADYRGLGEAVSETANEALAAVDAAARAQLPRLIVGLVRDFAADPVTGKPSASIGALNRARFEAGRPERGALVEAFVAKRLLTAEGDAASERVRPTHESLLRIWPEAVAIVDEAAHLIRARAAIEPAAREWADAPDGDKGRHLEISPALLEGAMAYVEHFEDEADPTTRRFVAEAAAVADARRDRERRESERRVADAEAIARGNRRIARTTGLGLVAALALAALAGWQWRAASLAQRDAQTQRDRAERTLAAATETADSLVFGLAQKMRDLTGVPKPVVKDILDQARELQEQLLGSGESSSKLTSNHAAALGEIAVTELALGDTPGALAVAQQSRDIYARISAGAPDDVRFIHDLAYSDETMGDILQRQGKFDEAAAAYARARDSVGAAIARGMKDQRLRQDEAVIFQDLGALARARGDIAGAETLYSRALAIVESLAREQPTDAATRHGLAVAHRNLGDIKLEKGLIDAAAAEYGPASEIAHDLAVENPNNALLQRDYTLSQERLGETLTAKRDYSGALKAFDDGETTAINLAASDPANLEWQYDISIGHIEVGDTQLALGDRVEATRSFRDAVAIDKILTVKDPTNALWRTHYGDALERLGGALDKQELTADALAVDRDALAASREFLARDPASVDWAKYVIRAEGRVGDELLKLAKDDDALAAFRDALARARSLGADKSARDLVFLDLGKVGGALSLKGDAGSALAAFDEAERLARDFVAADPKAAGPRGQLAALLVSKAHMQARMQRYGDAVAGLREAARLSEALGTENPAEPLWPREQAIADDRLGDVLRDSGDAPGAIEAYRGSLAVADALLDSKTADPDLRATRTMAREALATVLEGRKDPADPLTPMREALALRRGVAEDMPDDPQKQRALLVDENNYGRLLVAAGKVDDALPLMREGLGLARGLAARAGADAGARNDLVISLFLVGTTLLGKSDWTAAAASLGEALPVARALAAAAPRGPQYMRMVGLVATNLGDALAMTGDRAGALAAYVESRDEMRAILALGAPDKNASGQLSLDVGKIGLTANAMLLAGDFSGALAALDEATPAGPEQNWLDLVRAAALMFLGRSEEARALYEKHRGEKTYGGKSWEEATLEGFKLLRGRGLENPLMAEIEAQFATPN